MAQFRFYEPRFLDSRWAFGANAYLQERLYRDFQRKSRGFSPTFGYPITHELRVNWGYTLENVEITNANGNQRYNAVLYNLNRSGRVSSVNAALSFDTRDNRLFPSMGVYQELRGEVSAPWLGAETSMAFQRIDLTSRFYRPLPASLVLKLNVQLGWAFGAQGGVPISERYFPGGIATVRGFRPLSLGPTLRVPGDISDPGSATRDIIIGGNKQAIFNLELEFPIIPQANVKGVIFVDAGNAYNENENMFYYDTPSVQHGKGWLIGSRRQIDPPLGLYYSFGFGFRWFSPIGPLRFEWGIPIVLHEPDGEPLVFEFTIGNFF